MCPRIAKRLDRVSLPGGGGCGLRHGAELDQANSEASHGASKQPQQEQDGQTLKKLVFLFHCFPLVIFPGRNLVQLYFSISPSNSRSGKAAQGIEVTRDVWRDYRRGFARERFFTFSDKLGPRPRDSLFFIPAAVAEGTVPLRQTQGRLSEPSARCRRYTHDWVRFVEMR